MVNKAWRPMGEAGPGINEVTSAYGRADHLPQVGTVAVLRDDDTIVVRLTGAIDGRVTAHLRSALVAVILRSRPHLLELDLSQVSQVDAGGTGTIVAGCQVAEDCGIEVVVHLPGPDIAAQLRQAGLPASARTAA